jgi:hypothetical protein
MKYQDISRAIDRYGGEWAEQIKCCSQCGHLVVAAADGSECNRPRCNGSFRPLVSFVDVTVPDTPRILQLVEDLRETRERVRNDEIKGTRDMKRIADGIQEALNDE